MHGVIKRCLAIVVLQAQIVAILVKQAQNSHILVAAESKRTHTCMGRGHTFMVAMVDLAILAVANDEANQAFVVLLDSML